MLMHCSLARVTVKRLTRSLTTTPWTVKQVPTHTTKTSPSSHDVFFKAMPSDSPYHFYQNKVLEPYIHQPISASTLRQYIFFGRQMNSKRLAKSANWVRHELLVRLAHRIRDFQQLPFLVGTNPHIEYVYGIYWAAFEQLRKAPTIHTMNENHTFCDLLRRLLEEGRVVVPRMALGVTECASYYTSNQQDLDRFFNRMFRSRISRRVLSEQHLALTDACENDWDDMMLGDGYVGIIHTRCSARHIIERAKQLIDTQACEVYYAECYSGVCPKDWKPPSMTLEIQPMHTVTTAKTAKTGPLNEIVFAYIPEQLEQILYELLSNAVRFTMAAHRPGHYPPLRVTVSENEVDVFIRVSDQGGGVLKTRMDRLWSYQARAPKGEFLHFKHVQKMPSNTSERVAQASTSGLHMGMGLPFSRVYAEYWGGELQAMTMDGYGTDIYVRIPRLGTQIENIDVDKHSSTSKISNSSGGLYDVPVVTDHGVGKEGHATELHPKMPLAAEDGWMQSNMVRA
ncbi:branched-chain alpha-ketoacid dehydrogenase kinase [Spinellus fusiger]|nr:branched-chain alpha-ketoacid dehydrogenase kinase [Spinellus fusiger]